MGSSKTLMEQVRLQRECLLVIYHWVGQFQPRKHAYAYKLILNSWDHIVVTHTSRLCVGNSLSSGHQLLRRPEGDRSEGYGMYQ